jgi:hypothetical protein
MMIRIAKNVDAPLYDEWEVIKRAAANMGIHIPPHVIGGTKRKKNKRRKSYKK